MPLAKDRFNKCYGLHRGADGITRDSITYSYETHNSLFDIVVIEGSKFYRVNMGRLSQMISNIKPIHYEIEIHFGI